MTVRAQQRDATRSKILDAAVAALVERGYAATSTVEVQRRAGVSRGALLHHFPTRAALFAATVEELVARNRAAVERGLREQPPGTADRIERAMRALGGALIQPTLQAELELWAIARTDRELRGALVGAERRARADLEHTIGLVFAGYEARPAYRTAVALTAEFLRGHSLSSVLRGGASERRLDDWARAVRLLLDAPREDFDTPS